MSKTFYPKPDDAKTNEFISKFTDILLIKNNPGSLVSSLHSSIITANLPENESKIFEILSSLEPKEFLSVYMHLLLYPILYPNLLSMNVCVSLNNILNEHIGKFNIYYMNLILPSSELQYAFNISGSNILEFLFDGTSLSKKSLNLLGDALSHKYLNVLYNIYKNKKYLSNKNQPPPSLQLNINMNINEVNDFLDQFISLFGCESLANIFSALFVLILYPAFKNDITTSSFNGLINPSHTQIVAVLADIMKRPEMVNLLGNKIYCLTQMISFESLSCDIMLRMSQYLFDGNSSRSKPFESLPNAIQFVSASGLTFNHLPDKLLTKLDFGFVSSVMTSLLNISKNDPELLKLDDLPIKSAHEFNLGNQTPSNSSEEISLMDSNGIPQLIVSVFLNMNSDIASSEDGQKFIKDVNDLIKTHVKIIPNAICGSLLYQNLTDLSKPDVLNLWAESMIVSENFENLYAVTLKKFNDEEQRQKLMNIFFSLLPSQTVETISRVNATLLKNNYAELSLIDGTYDYFKAQSMFLVASSDKGFIKKKIMNEVTQLHNKYKVRVGEANYKQRAQYAELANMFKAFIDVLSISQKSFNDTNKKPLVLDPSFANIIIGLVTNYLVTSYTTKTKDFNMLANLFANEITLNYPEIPYETVHGKNAENYQTFSTEFYRVLYSKSEEFENCLSKIQKYFYSENHTDHAIYATLIGELVYETPFLMKDYPKSAMKTAGKFISKLIECHLFRGIQLDVFKVILAINTFEVKEDSLPFYNEVLSALIKELKTAPVYSSKRDTFILNEIIKRGNLNTSLPGISMNLKKITDNESELNNSPRSQNLAVNGLINPKKPANFVNPGDVNLPEKISIDMSFTLNNVSNNNVQESAHNLRMILNNAIDNGTGVLETLAKLFTQRIKQDSNYHVVYRDLIYAMNLKPLLDDITFGVLTSISTVFSHSASSTKDKKLLKTLANWLGLSLIAKDKILTNEELPLRELLLDSWNKGYTQSSVPFVCTIIEYTKESSLFNYPNLWTASIIELLVEMNEVGETTKDANKWALKTTFNVEVLFKNLKISMSDIDKSNWLSNPDSFDVLTGKKSHESADIKKSEKMLQLLIQKPVMDMVMTQKVQQVNSGMANINIDEQVMSPKPHPGANLQMQQQMNIQGPPQQPAPAPHNDAMFTSLQGNTMFVVNPDLQVAFKMAIAKSVNEILVSVVEKSSTTAAKTARALVAKDFATEANPDLYKYTCVKTARQLAKSATYISSASVLRANIINTTRQLCGNVMILLQNVEEELVTAIDDNIDMAISVIENAAMDKATTIILDAIIPDISFRQHHVQRRSGQPFHYIPEGVVTSTGVPLPDALKMSSEGITNQQLAVYQSLDNMPLGTDKQMPMNFSVSNQSNNSSNNAVSQASPSNVGSMPMNAKSSSVSDRQSLLQQLNKVKNTTQQENQPVPMMHNPPGLSGQRPLQGNSMQGTPLAQPQQLLSPEMVNPQLQRQQNMMFMGFEQQLVFFMNMIDAVIAYIYDSRDEVLDSVITIVDAFVIRIISGIASSKQVDSIALAVSQTCVSRMFEFKRNQLVVVVFTTLIQKLCIMSPVAKKDVNWWLVHSQNPLKMDTNCLLILNKIGVLEASQFDTLLSGLLKSDINNSVDFVLDVLKNLLEMRPLKVTKSQLTYTITLLKQVEDKQYKEKIRTFMESKEYASLCVANEDEFYTVLFTEWANLIENYRPSDLVCRKFLAEFLKNVPTLDKFISFLNIAFKLSYDSFLVCDPQSNVFKAIDSLAFLVIHMIIYQNNSSNSSRAKLLSIVLVAFQSKLALHANDKQFNGRPFFRFVSVILSYWQQLHVSEFDFISDEDIRRDLLVFNKDLYTIVTDMLHICQPMLFPSFSFSCLGLFSHRMYLPIMLKFEGDAKGEMWKKLNLLLIDLFRFLKAFGENGDESIKVLNAGILRIVLFIANDCPEYLIENHYALMNELPREFKHLRNIINSSIPQGMTFPNALNQFVSIDSIEESLKYSPNVAVSLVNDLGSFKKPLDSFLRIPSSSLNRNIMNQIAQLNPSDTAENFKIINAIVTHSVVLAGDELLSTSKQVILNETSSYFNLLSNLITNTISEKKEIAMNVIDCLVNHLRFPNTQTYFTWYVLTTIFNIDLNDKELTKKLNWNEENIGTAQEMILRSLLDRLLVSKPHPWGCVMTLMSILKKIDNVEDLRFVNKDESSGESVFGLMTSMKSLFEKTNRKVEVQ